MKNILCLLVCAMGFMLFGCQSEKPKRNDPITESIPEVNLTLANILEHSDTTMQNLQKGTITSGNWVRFELDVPVTGRYNVVLHGKAKDTTIAWVEDYIFNTDDRTYDITGDLKIYAAGSKEGHAGVIGSPLSKGKHPIKLHCKTGELELKDLKFSLAQTIPSTPNFHTQSMEGSSWELIWADEFEGTGLPDSTKWTYNLGDWGWGNHELQFYTDSDTMNARLENGNLIIEAHKLDDENWTSARLTTQGRHAFTYGKVEFRAKVPHDRGTWAAGWMLGDRYKDELSWPYCGEIDILECVGYEIDDETGNGINHATCHTPAYYFKKGNQIGADIAVEDMTNSYHTYTMEWYPDSIIARLDGEHYYTYDKTADTLEWPFHQPQNIIVNLAIGGGWGGAKGIDSSFSSTQFIIDYVRVYQKI
jgi:beta-glucanase (GH16 family)